MDEEKQAAIAFGIAAGINPKVFLKCRK